MVSLPKSFKLDEPIPSLPDGANGCLISCRPISGSPITAQSIVEFDLGTRGWLDPTSLAIRYKVVYTGGAAAGGSVVIGTPLYTPFQRLQITANGTTIDSISQYNQVCHTLANLSLGISEKAGRMNQYGWNPIIPGDFRFLDGRLVGNVLTANASDTTYLGGPLPCIISQSEKMIPLFAVGNIRFTFTLDSLANMSYSGANGAGTAQALANMAISNFELVYNMVDLGKEVEQMVKGMGPRLFIKSHSYNNSATAVASGATGSSSYVFNQRYSSIRSAFILPNQIVGSKSCEFCDLTSTTGDYQLQIGNSAFPQMPLSSFLNQGGILQETFRAVSNIYSNAGMSVDQTEFGATINTVPTLYNEPGKFIVGVNLEKCQNTDHVLMSGVSTYNSPISVVINSPTASTAAANLNLLLDYDAIIVIDQEAHNISVRS